MGNKNMKKKTFAHQMLGTNLTQLNMIQQLNMK